MQQHHPSPMASAGQEPPRQQDESIDSLLKWVSVKELFFVFLACSVAAVLLKNQDRLEFRVLWSKSFSKEYYENGKFPLEREKMPLPKVTDLESNGLTDIVAITPDGVLAVHKFKARPRYLGPEQIEADTIQVSLPDFLHGSRPVALEVGFLEPYQSMVQVRRQVIVVLASDWTVLCFNSKLKLLWSKQVANSTVSREASILISPTSIKSDDAGSVVVGGRVSGKEEAAWDSFSRKQRGPRDFSDDKALRSLGHFSTFALEGKTGELRWSHRPGDFEVVPAYFPDTSSFMHIKLLLHKNRDHRGEVSWHQYSSAIKSVLPHSWKENSDTFIELAHFSKDRKKSESTDVSEHVTKVGGLAIGHFAGYAFGGLRPHSPQEHVEDPNVLVIHSMKGLEVLHLLTGRPLFSVPLSPTHTVHADVNSDGIIDHVHAVVSPGDVQKSDNKDSGSDCYGQALPITTGAKQLFRHSICKATHWTETFVSTDKWLPSLNKIGRKKTSLHITEPITPVIVQSTYHQHPLKLSQMKRNMTFDLHQATVYDSVFVLSNGRITSIGPGGEFNWQVDIKSDWDAAVMAAYMADSDKSSKMSQLFSEESFSPAAMSFSLKAFGKETHVLVVGWEMATILQSEDGGTTSEFGLPCQPVQQPVVADFTGDGINDIIITCDSSFLGFSPIHHSGFWQNTALSLFVGMVIVIAAVYMRQKTGLLMSHHGKEA